MDEQKAIYRQTLGLPGLNLKQVYFSPTGSTKKIVEGVAMGMGSAQGEPLDLTYSDGTDASYSSQDLVIIGTPVYGGRIPREALKRISPLKADGAQVILIIVYGNREWEDALLELYHFTRALGFHPIVCAAFIGEHSFSTKEFPIAQGRPDREDIQKAIDLGSEIRKRITSRKTEVLRAEGNIPGRFPYQSELQSLKDSPYTREALCKLCGVCVPVCPTSAISINERIMTAGERCIHCCACLKKCPHGARACDDGKMKAIAKRLSESYILRKEPQVFWLD